MNKFMLGDGKSRAGLARIRAQPSVLAKNGSGLLPKADVVTPAIAIEALLPRNLLALTLEGLGSDRRAGIVGEGQQGPKLPQHAARRIAVPAHPARGLKRRIHMG